MSRTFASRLAGDINTVILSITQHPVLLTMSPLEPRNKPAAKLLYLCATVLLSGPCESLCDSNLGQEAAGAWPPPSILQQSFCLALRGQRQCSSCQLHAWWQAKGPSPQDGKVNKRPDYSYSFSLLHSPLPKDRPQFYNAFCHQTIRPGATSPNTLGPRKF